MGKNSMRIIILAVLLVLLMGLILPGCVPSTPSSPAGAPTPTVPETAKKIIIRYSSSTMNQVGEWNKADPGYTYLVLDLDIENRGYDSFSTNPLNFSVVVNNVKYNVAWVTTENLLKAVDLLNGGKANGTLAFEVPTEVSSAGYQIRYAGFLTEYDIEWIKQ